MFWSIIFLLLGFIFLIKGADFLVDGSSSIAKKYKISNLVIGLTIVAFGTSAPELLISAIASFEGNSGISLGNIIGSNISNTLLILGIISIISPIVVSESTVNKEIPFSFLAILALAFLVNDFLLNGGGESVLTRGDGLVLLLFFIIFIYYTFGLSKTSRGLLDDLGKDELEEIHKHKTWVSYSMITGGLLLLFLGGEWIVSSATDLAYTLGLSQSLVGLTIVALGTSLPELAASITAARRGKASMAVGNVVGSNIFNFLWVLGFSSMIRPITYSSFLNIDILVLAGVTLLLIFLIYLGKKNILTKKEGLILLSLYFFYIIYLIARG
ncbi:calcium/sodium antiporter [bacterium]|nr:calcium/sodium antiporter [bacterium]